MLVSRDARIADRAKVDRVVVATQCVKKVLGQDGAVFEVAVGAEVEPVELQGQAEPLEKADADFRDFGPDSVAGDDCDAVGHRGRTLPDICADAQCLDSNSIR